MYRGEACLLSKLLALYGNLNEPCHVFMECVKLFIVGLEKKNKIIIDKARKAREEEEAGIVKINED